MDPETKRSSDISASLTGPTRRRLLSLLGAGAIAGGFANLVGRNFTEAKKKKRGKKMKGSKGGKGICRGSVSGSASAAEEAALLQMINDFRAANGGLPALAAQANLNSAAAAHSQDMASRCYFDHVSPDGADPFERMAVAGYPGAPLAENLYKGSGNLGSAAQAFEAWKNSPGHRTNMLHAKASHIGVGTTLDGSGFMIWTNVFGRPRSGQ